MTDQIKCNFAKSAIGEASYSLLRQGITFNEKGELYFHINNFTHDLDREMQLVLLKDAFDDINYLIYPLRIKSTTVKSEAYFQIYFATNEGSIKPPTPFTELELAKTYYFTGEIYLNDNFYFALKHQKGSHAIKPVLQHEIAHAMGLGHSEFEDDLMFWRYNPNNTFTHDSIGAFHILYRDQMEQFRKHGLIKKKSCIDKLLRR